MKKSICVSMLMFMFFSVTRISSVSATVIDAEKQNWDEAKQQELGHDGEAMKWWLGNYGKINGIPYVIVRRYYTGNSARYRRALRDRLGKKAKDGRDNNLYFTEYGYEYTEDGKHFFEIYARHYNRAGQLLLEEDGIDETRKINVNENFGAENGVKYAMLAENQLKNIDDGTTEVLPIGKIDDETGIHSPFIADRKGKIDDTPQYKPESDTPDNVTHSKPEGRQWQYWSDVKGMWREDANYQFTNWTFSPNKTTVELVNKSGRKIDGPITLTSVKDRGFVFNRGVEQGTQLVVPEGCELHCDPSKVDTKGKRPADKRGAGVAFYPGETVYYKQTTSPGFTIFPYHAYPLD